MTVIISPSLLSADFTNLGQEILSLEKGGIRWVHLDVMDGTFVPNITYGPPVIKAIRKASDLFFDVHLMISDPGRYIGVFAEAGADMLVAHLEATPHPQKWLANVHEFGLKAGIALDPDGDPASLRWLLPYLDMVLIMGVNPGFSGQKFIPETIEKTRYCRAFLDEHGFAALPIQVDGGITLDNAGDVAKAGATIIVSGSAFFKFGDYAAAKLKFDKATSGARLGKEELAALKNAESWRPRQENQNCISAKKE